VEGIEDVEEILHAVSAGFAVVQRKNRNGEKRPVLDGESGGHVDAQCKQCGGEDHEPLVSVVEETRQHRKHDSEEAVVNIHKHAQNEGKNNGGTRQNRGKNPVCVRGKLLLCKSPYEKIQTAYLPFETGFHGVTQSHNYDGNGEGDENSEQQMIVHKGIHDLTEGAENEDSEKIMPAVPGIAETFGDAVGVKRKGEPSDDAENHLMGEENQPHVVDEHGYSGDEF